MGIRIEAELVGKRKGKKKCEIKVLKIVEKHYTKNKLHTACTLSLSYGWSFFFFGGWLSVFGGVISCFCCSNPLFTLPW